MGTRKWLISGILTFFILLIGMVGYQYLRKQKKDLETLGNQPEKLRSVEVRQFRPEAAVHEVFVDGRLKAFQQVHFSASVSGVLLNTSKVIKKGMYVQKGELIFDIDRRKARHNLHAMRSGLLNAITLVMPDLKLDFPASYLRWKQYLDQFDIEAETPPLPEVENDKEKYFVAAKNLFQLYYNIKSLEASMSDYQIYAPFSGEIIQADIYPGTMVNPGQFLGSMINTSYFELVASVPETELPYLKVGRKVKLKSNGVGKNWIGSIKRIGNQIDAMTQHVPVYIGVSGEGLKDGMYLTGTVDAEPIREAVRIPVAHVVNQNYIYTVKDSVVQLCPLKVVKRDEKYIYVLDYDQASWVVSGGVEGLYAGQKIMPVHSKL